MKEIARKYPRAFASVVALFAYAVAAWWAHATLERARLEHPDSIGLFEAFPALVIIGVIMTVSAIAPNWLKANFEGMKERKKTRKDIALIGLFIVPGILAYAWIKHELSKLGYD